MQRTRQLILIGCLLVGILLCHLVAPARSMETPHTTTLPASARAPIAEAGALLDALALHGWDSAANAGRGGVRWTWHAGNASGTPGSLSSGDNPLLDVDLLAALWRARVSGDTDPSLDGLRTAITGLVKHLAPYPQSLEDGAIALTMQQISQWSGDPWYGDQAEGIVERDVATLYHPALGALYWADDQHPQGWYRTAQTLELAAAFVVEGRPTHHPEWVSDAIRAVAFVQAHAYLAPYRVFLNRLGQVVRADGTVNPNEAILRVGDDGITDDGGSVTLGDIARESLALLTVSQSTHDATRQTVALTLLTDELPDANHLTLWDATNDGYATSIMFPGTTVAAASRPSAPTSFKRASDHAWLVLAEIRANTLAPGQFTHSIQALQQILMIHAIDPSGPGVFAEVTPDWHPVPVPTGGTAVGYDSLSMAQVALALLATSTSSGLA